MTKKVERKMIPWLWLIVGGLMATAVVVVLIGFTGMNGKQLRTSTYIAPYTPPTPTPIIYDDDNWYDPVLDCINNQCKPMWDTCVSLWQTVEQKCRDWGRQPE